MKNDADDTSLDLGPPFDPEDWISAAETIRLVRTDTLSHFAHQLIAQRAYAGRLRTMAETLIMGKSEHTDVLVPKEFWWAGGHEALDQSWEVGDFSTWIERKHHIRAFGVWFYLPDLKRMIPRAFPQQAPLERRNAGRPMSKDWPEWVAELAAYIHDEGIPAGQGSDGQDELIAAIDERLIARGLNAPGRSTVQEAAKAVLIRLRQAGK